MSHCGLCGKYINDAFHGEWSLCDEAPDCEPTTWQESQNDSKDGGSG